jgi:hypothetical protein
MGADAQIGRKNFDAQIGRKIQNFSSIADVQTST